MLQPRRSTGATRRSGVQGCPATRHAHTLRPAWWLLAPLALWLVSQAAWGTTPAATRGAQRASFKQAYAAAQHGDPAWQKMAKGLRDYPLYPWLQAAALEHDLAHTKLATVQAYLEQYPSLITATDLRRHYLAQLAQRKDWHDFTSLYQPGLGTALDCDALRAQLAAGQKLSFKADLQSLWQRPALPSACQPVLDWAHGHGLLTSTRLWARINHAAATGHHGTVTALAAWLPKSERGEALHLADALANPAKATGAALGWPVNAHNRAAAALAMRRLARLDSDQARSIWPQLRKHFQFTSQQTDRILAALALFTATDFTPDALPLLRDLPAAAQTGTTREWRVRVALAERNWPAALKALDALAPSQQDDGEWRYWRARVLDKLGQKKTAAQIYGELSTHADYYGFLAADRAHLPYTICPRTPPLDGDAALALLQQPAVDRAFELFAVGLFHDARRVWHRAFKGASTSTRNLAAMLAFQHGWYDRAIRAFSYGAYKHYYAERFPLADRTLVVDQSAAAGITPIWAYAIIRAESAFMSDARSSADARGLMQLLPRVGRRVAARHDLAWTGNLYDPQLNVTLGTRYLAHLADRYDGSPWLASAAYNAGPNRVDAWIAARGELAPDLFVVTIPFHETRDYVMRVMAYSVIYDWRLHGNAAPLSGRMLPAGTPYAPATSPDARKTVVCAASQGKGAG